MCLESRLEVKWQIYSRGSLILEKRCVKGRARCWCALVNFVLPTPQPTGPQRTLVHHHEKKTGFLNEKGHHAKSSLEENLHDDVKEQKIKFWVQLFRVSHELELPEYQSNKKKKKVYIFKQLQLLSSPTVCINDSQKSKVSNVAWWDSAIQTRKVSMAIIETYFYR